jgi:hypothetical protein
VDAKTRYSYKLCNFVALVMKFGPLPLLEKTVAAVVSCSIATSSKSGNSCLPLYLGKVANFHVLELMR